MKNTTKANYSQTHSGIEYLVPQSRYTALSFVSGFGRSKRLWVLDHLACNPSPEFRNNPGISERSCILFALACTFLVLGFRSILGQAKVYFDTRWYRKDHMNHQSNQHLEVH